MTDVITEPEFDCQYCGESAVELTELGARCRQCGIRYREEREDGEYVCCGFRHHSVPVEELESLIEEWRNHGVHPADGGRDIEKCAGELERVLEELSGGHQ